MRRLLPFVFLLACTTASAPTLPIPPPTALSSAPDGDGFVEISGEGAIEGAMVLAYNETLETGVIGIADDLGRYSLRLRADIGNSVLVWQRVGTDSSMLINIVVPDR
ncbi:MAG: hypothetical protein AAGE52_16190 [Myxococcota bacterium]